MNTFDEYIWKYNYPLSFWTEHVWRAWLAGTKLHSWLVESVSYFGGGEVAFKLDRNGRCKHQFFSSTAGCIANGAKEGIDFFTKMCQFKYVLIILKVKGVFVKQIVLLLKRHL